MDTNIKVKKVTFNEAPLTSRSVLGAYYGYIANLESLGIAGKTVIGLYLGNWSDCSNVIVPFLVGNSLGLMSPVSTSASDGEVYISYIDSNS